MNFLCVSSLLLSTLSSISAYETLAGYEPRSQITDQAAIDLDQQALQERAGFADWVHARHVYQEGGHSGSYALLTLLNPVPNQSYKKGTPIAGFTERGGTVFSELLEDVEWGVVENVTVRALYGISDVQSQHVDCMVGGLYTFQDGFRHGCFEANGTVQMEPLSEPEKIANYNFVYDNRRDNRNLRTLRKFSQDAKTLMNLCDDDEDPCYIEDYKQFYDYYGDYDYGDKWVLAAAGGNRTNFAKNRGNADFLLLAGNGGKGRAEAMYHGSYLLNLWMVTVRQMELAVDYCNVPCDGDNKHRCKDTAVIQWDRAVAYYAGSLQGQDGDGDGVLSYALADSRSREFKTAGFLTNEVRGTSYVNLEIMHLFSTAQTKLVRKSGDNRCDHVKDAKERIVNLMKVPLIQTVYRYAWKRHNDVDAAEKHEAKGATYMAALLPYVYACKKSSAETLYQQMKIGSKADDIDFEKMKLALEDIYGCLGVTCSQIGMLYKDGDYLEGATPCFDGIDVKDRTPEGSERSSSNKDANRSSSLDEEGTDLALILVIVLAVLGVCAVMGLALLRFGRGRRQNDFDEGEKNIAAVTAVSEADLA